MKKKDLLVKIVLIGIVLLLLISLAAPAIFSQASLPTPRRETLLNGARLITYADPNAGYADPNAGKVWVRVRVHSGSAFDPQGKEGTMMLLSRHLFPNPAAVEFFEEDLEGSLRVDCSYDHIQITASAKPEEFLTMLETIANAVSSPTIDKETTDRLKAEMNDLINRNRSDISSAADEAVKQRLFGTFPYGRPIYGSTGSLDRITFADVIEARKRFLNADNTSIVISGKFDRALATRAAKRYFGGWLKGDRKVPPTFKQPDAPSTDTAVIASESFEPATVRFALRGAARADNEFAAAEVAAEIMQQRLRRKAVSGAAEVIVSNFSLMLPGYLVFAFPASAFGPVEDSSKYRTIVDTVLADPIDTSEFGSARSKAADKWRSRPVEDLWLDADTYKIASVENYFKAFDSLTLADVRSFAQKLSKQPMASVKMLPAAKPE
jgi:predicted Zn-dependent peptidase